MAVPRDIDEKAGEIPGVSLYNMDDLGSASLEARNEKSLRESMEILEDYREELERWFAFREHIDLVKNISQVTTEDACKRMEKSVSQVLGEELQMAEIYPAIETAVDKAVEKLLFGLRHTLPQQEWKACLCVLE